MAKIATDLEQSKQLAEILPIESADMTYSTWTICDNGELILSPLQGNTVEELQHDYGNQVIPAWSLSALLDILPNNKHIETGISRGSWQIHPVEYLPNIWWCEYEDTKTQTNFSISADNQVDACVKMILKLKEEELL